MFLLLPLAGVSQIVEGGNGHAIILDKTGQVWTVGRNNFGQLGDSTTINSAIPQKVKNLDNIAVVARGYDHSMALDSNGNLWAWGRNNYGQTGVWSVYDQWTPQLVKDHKFIAVEGGHWHSVGLKEDGTVWAWGHNFFGELGNGTREHSNIPVQVWQSSNGKLTPFADVISIASVGYHVIAIKKDGTVWGWGANDYGQVGKGYPGIQAYAVQVHDIPHMKMISTGWHHSVGLDSAGHLWVWGSDPALQSGEEIRKVYLKPVMFENLPVFTTITCGSWHTLAIDEQKNVWAWGNNVFGMLGLGDSIGRSFPVMIPKLKNVTTIGAGCFQSMVVNEAGTLFTFGDNPSGQLGNDSINRCFSPITMSLDINGKLTECPNPVAKPAIKEVIIEKPSFFTMELAMKIAKYLFVLASIFLNIYFYRKLKKAQTGI